jgi:hypothetical protein
MSPIIPITVFFIVMGGIIGLVIASLDPERFLSPERGRKNLARILTGIGMLCFIIGSCQWIAYGDRKVADIRLCDLWFLLTGMASLGLAAILTILAYMHGLLATRQPSANLLPTPTVSPNASSPETASITPDA